MTRTTQITDAVELVKRVHDDWEADPQAPAHLTESWEAAITNLVDTCEHGDIPAKCRALVRSVERFGVEWQAYQSGDFGPGAAPKGSFWSALRDVFEELHGATSTAAKHIEPVHVLLAQMERDPARFAHVAKCYGRRVERRPGEWIWQGPFYDERGSVLEELIVKQAKFETNQDGGEQVIPDDWVHPNEQDRVAGEDEALRERLDRLVERESATAAKVDPATIEELLREGQYVDVIARIKHTTEEEVRKVADGLGIEVAERPNLSTERAPHEPTYDREALDNVGSVPVSETTDDDPEATHDDAPSDDDVAFAIMEAAENNPAAAEPHIARLVSEQLGVTVTPQQVREALAETTKA